MKNYSVRLAFALLVSLGAATGALGDIKVKTKTTVAGNSIEGTTYIKGARQRTSQNVGGAISFDTLFQCDLKRMIQINDRAKKYMIVALEAEAPAPGAARPQPEANQPARTRRGGVITYTTTITDTGERKNFFGFSARHIKTSMVIDSSPDACNPTKMKMESDGWYIDLEYGLYCSSDKPYAPMPQRGDKPECQDEIRYKTSGGAKLGYPVSLTTTIYTEDGRTTSTSMEVVELSTATLDAALFDVPAGYSLAKDYQELMAMASVGAIPDQGRPAGEQKAGSAATVTETRRPGVIRVGVVAINNKTDRGASTDALRGTLISSISGSNIEAVALDSTSSPAVEAEARRKGCDYILYTDIAELKKSGSKAGGLLGRATGVGIAKERHEARLDFRLFPTGSTSPQLTSSSTAKEEGDENVSLTAAAEREARAVVADLQKRK